MKSEYYTLHTNGSFDKIDVNELFNKKVTYKKWKKFLNRTTLVISFNLIILLLLGVALIVILSIHISQNILFKISTLLQVAISLDLSPVPIIPILIISTLVVGSLLTLTAFLGIVSMFTRKTTKHLYSVVSALFLSLGGLVAVGVLAIYCRDSIEKQLQTNLVSRLEREYLMPGGEKLTMLMDITQTQLHCCGVTGYQDYTNTTWQRMSKSGQVRLPLTCCTLENSGDDNVHMNPRPVNIDRCQGLEAGSDVTGKFRNSQGCHGFLMDIVTQELVITVGLSLGSSLIILVTSAVICFSLPVK